jgi:hypothetical protein
MRQIGSTAAGPSNAALPVLWLLFVGSGAAALIYEVVWFQLLQLAWLGSFYAGNIAGAVAGSLLAGLYLLRFYDVSVGTYAAVGLNVTVAAIAWLLAGQTAGAPAFDALDTPPIARAPGASARSSDAAPAHVPNHAHAALVYWTIAISGLTALASQVVWTRLLSLLFGGTVDTFALIRPAPTVRPHRERHRLRPSIGLLDTSGDQHFPPACGSA